MPLTNGARLASYEILGPLGAGGMGEVYRARDTKLQRDVAIKVLPELFAADLDRLTRFEREARAVAALSHPNILAIHDFGAAGGTTYAVTELLEGESLRAKSDGGALPVRRSIEIAIEIARGLAAAHERGIVHRDLKPENIFITRDGHVKILDFGLARQMEAVAAAGLTTAATDPGTVLGTAGYMAPEQVRGLTADSRADVFSFGVVFYELLTGRRAFTRDSAAETMAAIVKEAPSPLATAGGAIPPAVERIVWRCLEKDPGGRFQSAHDLAFALESVTVDSGMRPAQSDPALGRAFGRSRATQLAAWVLAGLAAGVAGTWLVLRDRSAPAVAPLARYDLQTPADARLLVTGLPSVAVSPDGSTVAFVATRQGVARLYVRQRAEVEARALADTEGAAGPTFSPDGEWLAFGARGDLKKVALDGAIVTLARGILNDDWRGVTWPTSDTLVVAPDPVGGLVRLPAAGGTPVVLTAPDAKRGERTHRWPGSVTGVPAVLFTVGSVGSPDSYEDATIDVLRLDTGERRTVLTGASMARHLVSGHLAFARGGSLHTIPFDIRTLAVTGRPTVRIQEISTDFTSGAAHFSTSDTGSVAYVPGTRGDIQRRLVWMDRSGPSTPVNLPPAVYNDIRLSPDGSRGALVVGPSGSGDVYILDLGSSNLTRLTFNGSNAAPFWSADGRFVYYSTLGSLNTTVVMRKPADGSRDAESLANLESRFYIEYLSGTTIIGTVPDRAATTRSDIVRFVLGAGTAPTTLVGSPVQEYLAAVSPDGRWLAYCSEATGRMETFVRDLSGGGGQWQISFEGGEEPRWSPNGGELYFRSDTRMMVAKIQTAPAFKADAPTLLFDGAFNLRVESGITYAVHPKNGKFLMIRPATADALLRPGSLRVVLNWFSELR